MAGCPKQCEILNLCGIGVVSLTEVIDAAGISVKCQENSPQVRYEVNTDKLCSLVHVPSTREAVLNYVKEQVAKK